MNESDNFSSLSDPTAVTIYDETLINCEVYDESREDDVGEVMVEIVGTELLINGVSNEDGSWNWETEDGGDEYKYSMEDILEPINMIEHYLEEEEEEEEGESKINLKIEKTDSNPMDSSSASEILSLLHLVAVEPNKGGYDFLSSIATFFSGFRNSISVHFPRRQSTCTGKRKRKTCNTAKSSPEVSEYDEVINSYRDERSFENCSDELLSAGRCVVTNDDWRRVENGPTELVLNFCQGNMVPVESSLNKMFKRFGPLKELETEVDRERWRARVVFKRWSDAEVAFSSAGAFNIFGPVMVNYQLNYAPTTPFQSLPFAYLEG
ncbi:uncharacterized protein LOC124928666 [Impatiens glandulifera]|uniref:uncharacterized protein LOC124928666 n=1 Tax=Impatiens glandulifera TaxID=253017 RepID=UPI001FB10EA2|nr:uncharacterized protein LOC124928666 [Impatiens glandulifera]XP_047324867.1 uncharacterized protein LOC124928666 [Impatiens glandulifera]XP_047324868.1 uncharacterized protein LOC124928666 [Impatiens glandulifera]